MPGECLQLHAAFEELYGADASRAGMRIHGALHRISRRLSLKSDEVRSTHLTLSAHLTLSTHLTLSAHLTL
jgi:hypothetical protein